MPGIDQYTKLLLHSNGVDTSKSHPITFNGTAQLDTAQSKFGGSSLLLDGNSDFVTAPDSDDWCFGDGDFTIDLWIRFNSVMVLSHDLCGQFQDANNRWQFRVAPDPNTIQFGCLNGGSHVGSCGTGKINFVTGQWYHLVFERVGNTSMIFVNGISQPVTQWYPWTTHPNFSSVLNIGSNGGGGGTGFFVDGWIDEFRISKGIARWTANFTPPIKQYVSDEYTCLLLHMDGADSSTSFPDASGGDESGQNKVVTYVGTAQLDDLKHPITFNGTAQLDTAQSKFGGSSLLLDGNSDYLTIPDSTDFAFGTGNFTIDCWVRFNDSTGYQVICGQRADGDNIWWMGRHGDNGSYLFYFASGGVTKGRYEFTVSPSNNVWYHLAFVRNGTTALFFMNGESQTLTEVTAFGSNDVGDVASVLYVGQHGNGYHYFNGWIDEFRISKGIARWTTNFTPPTSAHVEDLDTKLLLHFDGADGATTTEDVSHAVFGGSSLLLDGNSDYLTIPASADWDIAGSLDDSITLDLWAKFTNATPSGNQFFISQRTNALADEWRLWRDTAGVIKWAIVDNNVGVMDEMHFVDKITDTDWHHYAIIKTGSYWGMYIDGNQVAYSVQDSTLTIAEPLNIGCRVVSVAQDFFPGNIDELRFQHSNYFNANPVVGLTDTITVPTEQYELFTGFPYSQGFIIS